MGHLRKWLGELNKERPHGKPYPLEEWMWDRVGGQWGEQKRGGSQNWNRYVK